jgi:glycerol-3-phosphate dehydrogenase
MTQTHTLFDVFIIGGGINGAGIARDAAGRGLKVGLCEKGDLAQGTSSASTKLIHGGLRYLEHYDFRLVRESLKEREILLRMAPHIIWPMQFVIPYQEGMRPRWMIKAGLFLYDHLCGKRKLPASRAIDFHKHTSGESLKGEYEEGFIYTDCWVQDARLVILNAMDAKDKGAVILPRTECVKAERQEGKWRLVLRDHNGEHIVWARSIVNAAGPWAEYVAKFVLDTKPGFALRLVKGSHIVIRKKFSQKVAYLLQNHDKRVVFAIPYEQDFTLIGTTEVPYHDDPQHVTISEEEKQYLCGVASDYFEQAVEQEDICWSYAGVRPLLDNGAGNMSAISREYVFDWNGKTGEAPLLTLYGGKLTTYRKLAEKAVDALAPKLGNHQQAWTTGSILPGGDNIRISEELRKNYAWLPENISKRYLRHYGSLAKVILGDAQSLKDLGQDFGEGVYQAEIDYLKKYEWAETAEDILWRRTKLGLVLPQAAVDRLSSVL